MGWMHVIPAGGVPTAKENALLALNFRPPAVPCRLDFVAEFDGADSTAS